MTEQRGRTGRQLGLYVLDETSEELKRPSAQTDVPQSRLLRQALQLLFEEYSDAHRPKEKLPIRHRELKAAIQVGGDSDDAGSLKAVIARNRMRRGVRKASNK
jgi:Ribbon-helix-helix domain